MQKITKVHVRAGDFFVRPQVIVRIPLDVGIEDAQRIDVGYQVTSGLRKWSWYRLSCVLD